MSIWDNRSVRSEHGEVIRQINPFFNVFLESAAGQDVFFDIVQYASDTPGGEEYLVAQFCRLLVHHTLARLQASFRVYRFPGCRVCGLETRGKKMQQCGNCKAVKYCSAECQKIHWTQEHKTQCVLEKTMRLALTRTIENRKSVRRLEIQRSISEGQHALDGPGPK